jgi:hypothetical protein
MVMDETPRFDIGPYRLSRFSDGTVLGRPEMM